MSTNYAELAEKAKSAYRDTLKAIAERKDVSPEAAEAAALKAGRSLVDLAADVEIVTTRYDAVQEFASRDYSAEIAAAAAKAKRDAAAREAADAEFETVAQKRRDAHALASAASARVNHLASERDQKKRDLAALLRSTGSDSSWEAYRLSREPAPVAPSWTERVIDIGYKTPPGELEAARKAQEARKADAGVIAAECDYRDTRHVVA